VSGTSDDHDRLEPSLGLYLLGSLPAAEATEVERHLAGCDGCCESADALGDAVVALLTLRRSGALVADDLTFRG
jgi:anti-sigma factor RsiW